MRRVTWASVVGLGCLLGVGGGHVQARELPSFTSFRLRLSGLVTGVRMIDLDRDGRRDLLVVADRRVLVYRQGPKGFPEWADAVRSLPRGTVLADLWDPGAPAAPRLLLLDRRGIRELVWTGAAFAKKAPRVLATPTAWRAPPKSPVLVRPIVRDLTGDGRVDLLVPVADGFAIYGLSQPSADGTVAPPPLQDRVTVDLGARVAMLEQSRGGALYTEAFHPPLTAGDTDGDGRTDLVVRERKRVAIYRRDADGRLPREPTLTIDKKSSPREKKARFNFPMPVAVADITGDGVLDYVQAAPGDGTVMVFAGSAERSDFSAPDAVIKTDGYALGALPSDLDGDGRLDLLIGTIDRIGVMGALQIFVTKSVNVHSLLYYNRGPTTAAERFARKPDDERIVSVPLAFTTTQEGFEIGSTVLVSFDGDFNGDGRRDLLQRVATGTLGLWRGRPGRRYGVEPDRKVRIPTTEGWRFVIPLVEELNGDGRSDLVLHYRDWEDQANAIVVLLSRDRD